jgi:LSD1 subclass zinc finger protein
LVLDSVKLSRPGVLNDSETRVLRWELGDEEIASIAVGAATFPDGRRVLLLTYTVGQGPGTSARAVSEIFNLESVPMGFAGNRWFVRCVGCGERARKLYLPPGARHFRCLRCSRVTHFTAQTHDVRVDRLRRGDPDTVDWALAKLARVNTYGSIAWTMLAIKATCGPQNRPGRSSATVTFHPHEGMGGTEGTRTLEAARG